jgi:hypothetical protein
VSQHDRAPDRAVRSRWTRRRVGVLLAVALAATAVPAWLLLRGNTWTFTLTQAELEAKLAARFPLQKTYLLVLDVHYENPRVRLTEGSSEVVVGVDVRTDIAVGGKPVQGSADLVTKLLELRIAGVDAKTTDRVRAAANVLAAEQLSGIPVYRLKWTDAKQAAARFVLQSATVRDGRLVVVLGV